MRIVGISGSLRRASYNAALLRAATQECPPKALYVGGAGKVFDPADKLVDEATRTRLRSYMKGFADFIAEGQGTKG